MIDFYTGPTPGGYKVPSLSNGEPFSSISQRKRGFYCRRTGGGAQKCCNGLCFIMAGVGPNQGPAHAFVHYFPERIPCVISCFLNESRRLYETLNNRLADREFLCGDLFDRRYRNLALGPYP
jgi:hypothetical protein